MISQNAIRLLNLGTTAWARTQSVFRATAEHLPADSKGAVIFAQSLRPYLSHGLQQFASETFDLAACERLSLPVVRRVLPGEAEYCDVNQLLFQWVLPANQDSRPVTAGVLSALGELGITAEHGADQFAVNGARIGRFVGGHYENAFVALGCLYLSYDAAPLKQALSQPKPDHATSLWAEAPRPLAPDTLQAALIEHFARELGRPIERDTPRVPETQTAKRIERELLGVELADLTPEEEELQ